MCLTRQFVFSSVCLLSLFIAGCNRDNPLSDPSPEEAEEEVTCSEPIDNYSFLDAVFLSNNRDQIRENFDARVLRNGFTSQASVQLPALFDVETVHIIYDDRFESRLDDFDLAFPIVTEEREVLLSSLDDLNDCLVQPAPEDTTCVVDYDVRGDFNVIALSAEVKTGGVDSGEVVSFDDVIEEGEINITIMAAVTVPAAYAYCPLDDSEAKTFELDIERNFTFIINEDRAQAGISEINALQTEKDDLYGSSVELAQSDDFLDRWLVSGQPGDDSAASGAVNTDSVSAPGLTEPADNSLSNSGSVSVYRSDERGAWEIEAYVKATNPDIGDGFGAVVSMSGEYLAVSAPYEDSVSILVNGSQTDNLATDSGAVYVYRRSVVDNVLAWRFHSYVKPPQNTPLLDGYGNNFGHSLVLHDEFLYVGAPLQDVTAQNSGAVFVYKRNAQEEWVYQTTVKAPNPIAGGMFGYSIAYAGDLLVIGSPGESSNHQGVVLASDIPNDNPMLNTSRNDSGAAFIYRRLGDSLSFEAYIKPSFSDANDQFGYQVAVGQYGVFVSAPFEDSNGVGINRNISNNDMESSGAVFGYGYALDDDDERSWFESVYIKSSAPSENGFFGLDIDMDVNNIIIGEPGYSGLNGMGQDVSGRAYVFNGDLTNRVSDFLDVTYIDQAMSWDAGRLGSAVAITGDFAAIGATGVISASDQVNAGAVIVVE